MNFKNNCDAGQAGLVLFITLFSRTKQLVVKLKLTDKEVQGMEEMSENQRKVLLHHLTSPQFL